MKTVSKKLFSLLLVAALLVSIVPAAFADSHKHTGEWKSNGDGTHSMVCADEDCGKTVTNDCTFEDGKCKTCGFECDHAKTKTVGKKDATCIEAGYTGDKVCKICGEKVSAGKEVAASTKYHVDEDGNDKCDVCKVSLKESVACKLTLDANGGTVNKMSEGTLSVKSNQPIKELPTPVKSGYTFEGWYVGSTRIYEGATYAWEEDVTAVAKWTEITYLLTVRRVVNGDNTTAKTLYTAQVSKDTSLLEYLNEFVTDEIKAELKVTPGYTWENKYWKDFSGKQPLTSQSDKMDQAQTVFVNFKAKEYTLFFNANGGSVDSTSKTVTFGQKVGTLPTPTCSGKVFQGWVDEDGVLYTKDTVYSVPGDTSLSAVWSDEALVLLRIYVNGKTDAPDRIVVMDGYVQNANLSEDAVIKVVKGYYSAESGKTLSIAGLFTEATWADYKANTSKAGTPNVAIDKDHVNNVYVMVSSAKQGGNTSAPSVNPGNSTVTPGTSNTPSTGTGTADPSNPKTGDSAALNLAAAVMVLSAAAFVTVQLKKKEN